MKKKDPVKMAAIWMYIKCCVALDKGKDPRDFKFSEVMEEITNELIKRTPEETLEMVKAIGYEEEKSGKV